MSRGALKVTDAGTATVEAGCARTCAEPGTTGEDVGNRRPGSSRTRREIYYGR